MRFKVKKCKVLHIGQNNAYCDYSINGDILQSITEETDLEPSKQCVSAVKKTNMTLRILKRLIISRDENTIGRLY